MSRTLLARTPVTILMCASVSLILTTAALVWPYWARYQAVKALINYVNVEPSVCVMAYNRNNEDILTSAPVLEEKVKNVKRWQGDHDAVQSLTTLVDDKTRFEDVRRNAAYTLGLFPEEAPAIVPCLINAHRDDYRNVFTAAHWALKAIDPEAYDRAPRSWPYRE